MTTLTEVLPPTKSSKYWTVEFTPTDGDFSRVAGVMVVRTDKAAAAYTLEEYSTPWDGRGFMLRKLITGTDATAEGYDVFAAHDGGHLCDCKGHVATGKCKHVAAVQACLENGWL